MMQVLVTLLILLSCLFAFLAITASSASAEIATLPTLYKKSPKVFESSTLSSSNCTWKFIDQPLSHFERRNVATYKQRLCVYDEFWTPDAGQPVFVYTGNESPVEVYVNNTGLMWTLAAKFNALIIFAEHRYFGESIPDIENMEDCIAYLSSEEALADYASLSSRIRREWGGADSAIITFGGSYGGMLSSWMRILYPSAVDGAISASAPVWGFPLNLGCPLDSSAQVVTFAASSEGGSAPFCKGNLKASYVLISDIGKSSEGREALSSSMNLCTPLESNQDVSSFLYYLQGPLFNLAEGSYPFASSYITSALTGSDAQLPPWAMQVACNISGLGIDYGASTSGDEKLVKFTVSIGNVKIEVEWDVLTNNGYSIDDVRASGALKLATAAAQSVQVWYNVTGTMPSCIDWNGSILSSSPSSSTPSTKEDKINNNGNNNSNNSNKNSIPPRAPASHKPVHHDTIERISSSISSSSSTRRSGEVNICTLPKDKFDSGTAWNVLTCNEGINLVNWRAQGVGNDLYWPPNQDRGFSRESIIPGSLAYCAYLEGMGLYGMPTKGDDWSLWLDTAYGGERNQYATNIFYSNGNLDPWSPAGVPPSTTTSTASTSTTSSRSSSIFKMLEVGIQATSDGLRGEDYSQVKSVVIDRGGHHLDLFFESSSDPDSVKDVRILEEQYIASWISQVRERNYIKKKKN